jgi:hypothetical protein
MTILNTVFKYIATPLRLAAAVKANAYVAATNAEAAV